VKLEKEILTCGKKLIKDMWKDFRNLALVFVTVFAVLSFSVYTKNKMDRNSVFYDNWVATKEKIVQNEILELSIKKQQKEKEMEILELEKQRQIEQAKKENIYIPTVEVVIPQPLPVVVPAPTPEYVPDKVIVPKPSRQTRAS
jgi:hypothetical protein